MTPFLIKHVWLHFLRLCFLNRDSEPLLKYITQVAWQLNDITTFFKNTSFVSKIFNFAAKKIGGDTWCIYIWRKIMFISCRNINSKIFFLYSLLSIVIMMSLVFAIANLVDWFFKHFEEKHRQLILMWNYFLWDTFSIIQGKNFTKHPNWSFIFLLIKSSDFCIYCCPKFSQFSVFY